VKEGKTFFMTDVEVDCRFGRRAKVASETYWVAIHSTLRLSTTRSEFHSSVRHPRRLVQGLKLGLGPDSGHSGS
jgi:hypothetical protein